MSSMAMPELLLQFLEELEDLRLHRDVERGGRLIRDEKIGIVGERHGDHHPLALAARQLMRKIAECATSGSRMPDFGKQLDDALARAWVRSGPDELR